VQVDDDDVFRLVVIEGLLDDAEKPFRSGAGRGPVGPASSNYGVFLSSDPGSGRSPSFG
jgi:hypothetical protein